MEVNSIVLQFCALQSSSHLPFFKQKRENNKKSFSLFNYLTQTHAHIKGLWNALVLWQQRSRNTDRALCIQHNTSR